MQLFFFRVVASCFSNPFAIDIKTIATGDANTLASSETIAARKAAEQKDLQAIIALEQQKAEDLKRGGTKLTHKGLIEINSTSQEQRLREIEENSKMKEIQTGKLKGDSSDMEDAGFRGRNNSNTSRTSAKNLFASDSSTEAIEITPQIKVKKLKKNKKDKKAKKAIKKAKKLAKSAGLNIDSLSEKDLIKLVSSSDSDSDDDKESSKKIKKKLKKEKKKLQKQAEERAMDTLTQQISNQAEKKKEEEEENEATKVTDKTMSSALPFSMAYTPSASGGTNSTPKPPEQRKIKLAPEMGDTVDYDKAIQKLQPSNIETKKLGVNIQKEKVTGKQKLWSGHLKLVQDGGEIKFKTNMWYVNGDADGIDNELLISDMIIGEVLGLIKFYFILSLIVIVTFDLLFGL